MARKRQRSRGTGTLFKRNGAGPWLASWFDHNGKRIERSTRTTDKSTAERILTKRVADVALRRDGVIDPQLDAICDQSQRSIESHLSDFKAKMKTAGRTPKHIRTQAQYIQAIADHAGWASVSDIAADAVNAYACTLKDEGRSAQTIKNHLAAVTGFTKWLSRNHKLLRDPLASVSKPNPETDRRRERRILLPEEWPWLRSTTAASGTRCGMSGPERVLLYATAIQSGLRSNEMRSLRQARLFLDDDTPYITCKARSAKNRQDARQYIQPDLAADLRRHVATKAPQAAVFKMPAEYDVADMVRADLANARQAWLDAAKHDPDEYERRRKSDFLAEQNHDGGRFDFHSLRHTCGAWLSMMGAHPKAVQSVMRHSSITLTMDTYGHLFPGQEADTLARLPAMMGEGPETLRATGTADAHPPQYPQQLGRESMRSGATSCENKSTDGALVLGRQTPKIAESSERALHSASKCEEDATVAQLAEQRFCKPQVNGSSPFGGCLALRRTTPRTVASSRYFQGSVRFIRRCSGVATIARCRT